MKRVGIIRDEDGFFRLVDRKGNKLTPLEGPWNIYKTYTGAAAGVRAYRRNGPPARVGMHVTSEAVKVARRVR